MHIRPAVEADLPAIVSFIQQLANYEKLSHEVVMTEAGLRAELFGPRPAAEVLLAFVDGRAVGFALFFPTFSTFAGRAGIYLEDLFVEPEHRGRGIGKALLAHVAQLARERGCARLEWAVLDRNRPAIDFYNSLGAQPLGEWIAFRLTGNALERLAESAATRGRFPARCGE